MKRKLAWVVVGLVAAVLLAAFAYGWYWDPLAMAEVFVPIGAFAAVLWALAEITP